VPPPLVAALTTTQTIAVLVLCALAVHVGRRTEVSQP
jgi:hypothetical protein